jgi:hypothetical protein
MFLLIGREKKYTYTHIYKHFKVKTHEKYILFKKKQHKYYYYNN